MDEDNIITLNDENGNEVEFEFLDLIPYRQNEYCPASYWRFGWASCYFAAERN